MFISFWSLGTIVAIVMGMVKHAPFKGLFAGIFLSWFGVFLMYFVKDK